MLSSLDSPNTNKKRKLTSPTPLECKSPKLVKTTTKENSFDVSEVKNSDDINLGASVTNEAKVSGKSTERENDETNEKESTSNETLPKSKPKKSEEKLEVKPGALTRFFTKTENKDSQIKKSETIENKVEVKQANDANASMEVGIINKIDEVIENNFQEQKAENIDNAVLERKKSDEPEGETCAGKSEVDRSDHDSKDSLPSSKAVSLQADSDKDENSRSEQDLQEADISKIESDSESSGEEQVTDQRTDNDEPEDKKKLVDGKNVTPNSKKAADIKQKKMTPKQMEKKLEKQKRREERQKQRLVKLLINLL